jgi:hypothetical protein
MAKLQPIKPLIDELARKSSEIDALEDQLEVPRATKEKFGDAWGKEFIVKADYIKLKTAKSGEAGRWTEVFDPVLIKCANAVQLFNAYGDYKKQCERIKKSEPGLLAAKQWKQLGEDRDEPLPKEVVDKVSAKVAALSDLSAEEKKLLTLFMTAEKADREGLLGAYKGIERGDAFAPVAAKAFGMRVDYSGYVNDVIDVLVKHPDITKEILAVQPLQKSSRGQVDPSAGKHIAEAFRAICNFCTAYDKADAAWMKNRPECLQAQKHLRELQDWLQSQFGSFKGQSLRVKFSTGNAAFPKVPWVCLLPEGQEVNDGVYVSICFDRRGRGAVSGFAESASSPKGLSVLKRTDKELKIDVNGSSAGTHFNDGFVNPEEFFKDSFDAAKLRDHIQKSLDLCFAHLGGTEVPPMTPDDKNNFVSALRKCGFVAEGKLPDAFLQSLIAKPFVILTGNSGTGKTKIAELLASWLRGNESDGHELVAVGADWTDNRNVVGFVNHLRPGKDEKSAVYQSTAVLDLLLRATANPSLPFFLILDEMNLSHVERYLADFLSAMESREGVIRLHSEGAPEESDYRLPRFDNDSVGVPREVAYPRNLFVIGTVNVDETTYMFSPKVLDRAHVIEFQADAETIGTFLTNPQTLQAMECAPEKVASGFLALSKAARGMGASAIGPLPPLVAGAINERLGSILAILRRGRFEFAFRTAKELNSYLRVCRHLSDDKSSWDSHGWKTDLDDEILQKVLPRLHGSRSRVGNLVGALVCYFATGEQAESLKFFPADGQEEAVKTLTDAIILAPDAPEFPRCFKKMQTMARVLVEEQFVSFIC